MANTQGGSIVLGVAERGGQLAWEGVPDAAQLRAVLWNQLNDRQKISRNLLTEGDVRIVAQEGRQYVVVQVPRASRRDRPVYAGTNPLAGWRSQHWRSPKIEETVQPDRVRLLLPMVSLIPPEVEAELRERFGERFAKLDTTAVQAVVTASVEGAVTNGRMQEITDAHPKDITVVLQSLVREGFLEQQNQRRWASYRLARDSPRAPPNRRLTPPSWRPTPPNPETTPANRRRSLRVACRNSCRWPSRRAGASGCRPNKCAPSSSGCARDVGWRRRRLHNWSRAMPRSSSRDF
jgi:predicted HTH transcriptional regulator